MKSNMDKTQDKQILLKNKRKRTATKDKKSKLKKK